jgi:hypothetical protein
MATLRVHWRQSSCQSCLVTSLCSVRMLASPVKGTNNYQMLTAVACDCEEWNMLRLGCFFRNRKMFL